MNDKWIKNTATLTLVLFAVVLAISLMAIGGGLLLGGGSNHLMQGAIDIADPDDPGAGWLALGGIFGSVFGGFLAAFTVVIGLIGILTDIVVCAPILIGWLIWRKTGSQRAYKICGVISLILLAIAGILMLM